MDVANMARGRTALHALVRRVHSSGAGHEVSCWHAASRARPAMPATTRLVSGRRDSTCARTSIGKSVRWQAALQPSAAAVRVAALRSNVLTSSMSLSGGGSTKAAWASSPSCSRPAGCLRKCTPPQPPLGPQAADKAGAAAAASPPRPGRPAPPATGAPGTARGRGPEAGPPAWRPSPGSRSSGRAPAAPPARPSPPAPPWWPPRPSLPSAAGRTASPVAKNEHVRQFSESDLRVKAGPTKIFAHKQIKIKTGKLKEKLFLNIF